MNRFHVPDIFWDVFLTVAVFAVGVVFEAQNLPPTQQLAKQEAAELHSSLDVELTGSTWLTKDAAGFFTFALVLVGFGQAILFFYQLRYMRQGMRDTSLAAQSALNGALAAVEANKINRDNFLSDHRPWLGP